MKQVKKLLVVLPLVLVFVLGSLPVFAKWPSNTDENKVTITLKLDTLEEKITLAGKDFQPQADFQELGVTSPLKVIEFLISKSSFKDDYNSGKLKIKSHNLTENNKLLVLLSDTGNWPTPVGSPPAPTTVEAGEVELDKVPKEEPVLHKIVAVDRLTLARVPATIHQLENKNNAKSIYDMAHEFFQWETAKGNALKDYYFLGFAPDVNNAVTDLEQEQLDKYDAKILVWVVKKLQELNVTHVFPDRAPLSEKIAVDYWVLEKGQINNANAAEFAKTRIQKMNEQGFVFEKAEYTPYIYRESIMKNALDVYGKPIKLDGVVSTHGIFVYYKGAVVPAPVPDAEKKVDAASVQTGVQANVQAPVAAAGAQPQQLPATGVADNSFLFLGSAALMALGIFFFKKH